MTLGTEASWITGIDDIMANNDASSGAISAQETISPGENCRIRTGIVLNINDDKLETAGAEQLKMVVVIISEMATIVSSASKPRTAKPLIVFDSAARGPVWILIVIANRHAIWQSIRRQNTFQIAHPGICVLPLSRNRCGVHDVADLGDVNNIARHPVIENPLGLRIKNIR